MKWLLFLSPFLLLFYSCSESHSSEDQLVIDRMVWMNSLRASLDTLAWPGLTDSAFSVPFLYFSDSSSWIANPTAKFLQQHNAVLLSNNASLKVYKTSERLNSLPFQMATSMELNDGSSFNYFFPFIFGSSPEETRKTIPDVQSTEAWASMILHEYFHGFQFRHKPLVRYYEKSIMPVQADSLSKIYRKCDWFREQLDEENDLLLAALATENPDTLSAALLAFGLLRQERRELFKELYAIDIAPYEDYYEKIEGSARYVESRLLHTYKDLPPYTNLLRTDSTYKAHLEYKEFALEQEPWLYLSNKSGNYVYATGYNQLRLLDKLSIEYKSIVFEKPETSLYSLLSDAVLPKM